MSDHEIQVLESQFPMLSGQAFAAASERVLASGQSVLQSEGGFVFRVFPDGRKEEVKRIQPTTRVKPGTIYTIPPFLPPSGPTQLLFQEPPAKANS